MFFKIKRSTQLKKLMNAYCDRQSVDFNSVAFLFDGRRLRAEQTPDEVCVSFIFPHGFYISTVQLLVLTWTFIFAVGNGGWWRNWCNASSDWRLCTLSISASPSMDVTELRKIFLWVNIEYHSLDYKL